MYKEILTIAIIVKKMIMITLTTMIIIIKNKEKRRPSTWTDIKQANLEINDYDPTTNSFPFPHPLDTRYITLKPPKEISCLESRDTIPNKKPHVKLISPTWLRPL